MRRSSENVRLALVSAALIGVVGCGMYSCASALPSDDEDQSGGGYAGGSGYHGGYGTGGHGSGGTSTPSSPTARGGFGSHGSGSVGA